MVHKNSEKDPDAEPTGEEHLEEEKTEAEVTVEAKEKKELEEEELGECKCPHCGNLVVPKLTKTAYGGKSYRCPECGKFFKPKPREEEEAEAELPGEEEEKPLAPLEVEMTERIKGLLPQYLPRVYGIPRGSKRIQAIIDTITPEQTSNPWNLHAHIKNFAPEADDRHLEAIIVKIYSTLENEGFIQPVPGSQYHPKYARRGYGPHYPARGYPSRQWYGPGYQEEFEEEDYEGVARRPPKPIKIVVDGQTIETDLEGMMAWKRYKQEDEEAKRQNREHELRMKKLEQEITNLAKGGGEEKVAVKVGDQTLNVPASIAPFVLKGEDAELKALKVTIDDLKEKVHDTEKKLGEKEMGELKGQLSGLYSRITELENRDPLAEVKKYDAYAESRGYSRTGKSTVDLIGDAIDRADKRAQQLITKVGPKGEGEEGFSPEVKRSPQERQEMAVDIQLKLEKKEKILAAENELLEAAAKL